MKCKNRTPLTAASNYLADTSSHPRSFFNEKGWQEYKANLVKINQQRVDNGRQPLEDDIHDRIIEEANNNDGTISVQRATDMAKSTLPRSEYIQVAGQVAADLTARILHESPHLEVIDKDVFITEPKYIDPKDTSKIPLPLAWAQRPVYPTTTPNVVDKDGKYLDGFTFGENTNAAMTSKLYTQQPFTTYMDPETAVAAAEKAIRDIKLVEEKDIHLDEIGAIPLDEYDEVTVDAFMKSKEVNIETAREVFTNKIREGQSYFFQVFHDWRGRFYFKTRFFNPQGSSFEKATVAFNTGVKGTFEKGSQNYNEFAVHMANLAGKDKGEYATYQKRIEWFENNINSYEDIKTHYDPEDVIQASMHWQMFVEHNAYDIPIARDSTTSGWQLISLMMGDQAGLGELTNINGTPTKNDLYTTAAEKTFKKADIKVKNIEKYRKVFKKPTMTYIYGMASIGIQGKVEREYISLKYDLDNVKDMPKEEAEQWAKDVDKTASKLSLAFIRVLEEDPEFKTANEFIKILKQAYFEGKHTDGATWAFPDGQQVTFHAYNKKAYQKLKNPETAHAAKKYMLYRSDQKASYGDVEFTYNMTEFRRLDPPSEIDYVPVGLTANFVQSVDAYLANYVARHMMEKGYPIITVHDSFATTAPAVKMMQQLYLQGMMELTTPDANGMTFFEKAIFNLSKGKIKFKQKEIDTERLMNSWYALS